MRGASANDETSADDSGGAHLLEVLRAEVRLHAAPVKGRAGRIEPVHCAICQKLPGVQAMVWISDSRYDGGRRYVWLTRLESSSSILCGG